MVLFDVKKVFLFLFSSKSHVGLFNQISKRYELDFRERGRASGLRIQPSVKNFQLVMEVCNGFFFSQSYFLKFYLESTFFIFQQKLLLKNKQS